MLYYVKRRQGGQIMERAYIYGDSLLKATVPDAAMRYHFHLSEVMAQYPTERLEVVNRAKMGSTISKGLSLVEHDVARGLSEGWLEGRCRSRWSLRPEQSWRGCPLLRNHGRHRACFTTGIPRPQARQLHRSGLRQGHVESAEQRELFPDWSRNHPLLNLQKTQTVLS